MKKTFWGIVVMTMMFSACDDNLMRASCDEGVRATVRDLTGLDGCGFVFELEGGTRVEPYRLAYCGTGPLSKEITEDPLYDFEFVDGKQVIIGYEEVEDVASICMVGPIVKITCLEEVTINEGL
ncbi:MAG: hypothetical protein E6Q96_01115 [Cyclobacteriaceae bacterium]|nr:MAG: hypothetical protein E6Q96_01115 [Cyclobacteriaceae bacterium]